MILCFLDKIKKMKKLVLLLVLVATLWHKDAMAYGEDSFFGQGSMSESVEYKLYDGYAKSDADVKAEATNVPLGSGIVFLGVLAMAYGARKLKTINGA